MLRSRSIGNGHSHAYIGVVGIGGERFRAVDDPAVSVAHGRGARARGIRSCFRFCQRPATNPLARKSA